MKNKKISSILKRKNKRPIVCLTAYSKPIAEIVDKYCDIILVGDSLGMVLYGMKTTRNVKIETMILHARSVKEAAKKSLVIFDMPYKTYTNKFTAYKNAKKMMKLFNNIESFFPSDGDETEKMILQAYEREGPSFISLKSDPKLTRSIMGTK